MSLVSHRFFVTHSLWVTQRKNEFVNLFVELMCYLIVAEKLLMLPVHIIHYMVDCRLGTHTDLGCGEVLQLWARAM